MDEYIGLVSPAGGPAESVWLGVLEIRVGEGAEGVTCVLLNAGLAPLVLERRVANTASDLGSHFLWPGPKSCWCSVGTSPPWSPPTRCPLISPPCRQALCCCLIASVWSASCTNAAPKLAPELVV